MFKTSKIYLQSLLPTPSFRFKRRLGTAAYASLFTTTVGNMSWLGGGGYTHCGLYIYNIEYIGIGPLCTVPTSPLYLKT